MYDSHSFIHLANWNKTNNNNKEFAPHQVRRKMWNDGLSPTAVWWQFIGRSSGCDKRPNRFGFQRRTKPSHIIIILFNSKRKTIYWASFYRYQRISADFMFITILTIIEIHAAYCIFHSKIYDIWLWFGIIAVICFRSKAWGLSYCFSYLALCFLLACALVICYFFLLIGDRFAQLKNNTKSHLFQCLEKFSSLTHQVSCNLDIFMRAIHDTDFSNSVDATQKLLDEQGAEYGRLKASVCV